MKGIYKIRNLLNNKFYVGSSVNIKRRFVTHRHLLNKNKHHCEHLQRSWIKYGKENFIFEIVEVVDNSDFLELFEQKWIDGSDKNLLYNACKKAGNKSGFKHSDETKRKISESNKGKIIKKETKLFLSKINKGKKHTEETKKKMSESQKGIKKKFSNEAIKKMTKRLLPFMSGRKAGFKLSDETKLKISVSKSGTTQSDETKAKRAKSLEKPISQYDKNMNHIQDWESIKKAANELNIRRTFISAVLTGHKKSAKGFIFKYKNDNG